MKSIRSACGSALVLVVVSLFALLVVAFIVINFVQLMGTHKEAQTAIDAASLTAAKDMSRIVIDESDGCHFGVVGLTDDVPRKKDSRPVLGINTVMATVRLDAIIANKLGSSTMLVLAAHDLQRVQADSLALRKKIIQSFDKKSFLDKDGNKVNLLHDVNQAYDDNAIRLGNGKRVGDVTLRAGSYKTAQGTTNVPTPMPQSLAQVDASTSSGFVGKTVYKPLVDVPVNYSANGSQGKLVFKFLPLGNEISLVSESSVDFQDPGSVNTWSGYLPPYLVKAEVDQEVSAAATMGGKNQVRPSGKMHVSAVAACGSPIRSFGSGLFQIAMPGGPPPRGQGPDCTSVQSIMNSNQIKLTQAPAEINSRNRNPLTAAQLGTASSYVPSWNRTSSGAWLSAQGGAVPASAGGRLVTSNFRARNTDDPSVVLACCVYDWLHAMYLRPNAEAVVNSLTANLNLYGNGSQQTSWNFGNGDAFIPAAYASSKPKYPVTFGLFSVPTDGVNDPRDLRNFDKNPDGFRRQLPNVFGYVPADMTLPDQALVVAMDEESNVVTTNGESPITLVDFFNAVIRTNQVSSQTFHAAMAVLKVKTAEGKVLNKNLSNAVHSQDQSAISSLNQQISTLKAKVKRAEAAAQNAHYAVTLSLALLNDRKAISGQGITELAPNKFEIIGGYFLPPTKAATADEINGEGAVSTGQDASASIRDWCVAPKKGQPQIAIFQRSQAVTSSNVSDSGFLAPVFAASAVPQSQLNIIDFKVVGDVTADSRSGLVTMSRPTTTPAGANVISGQLIYQNTAALITRAPRNNVQEIWNCIARDNGANYAASTAYFANSNDAGFNQNLASGDNPTLIAEWTLRCPAPSLVPTNPSTPSTPSNPNTPSTPQTPVTPGNPGNPGTPSIPGVPSVPGIPSTPSTPSTPTTPSTPSGTCQKAPVVTIGGMGFVSYGDTGRDSSLKDVTPVVDSAGNVTYTLDGRTLHFFETENAWVDAANEYGLSTNHGGLDINGNEQARQNNQQLNSMKEKDFREYFNSRLQGENKVVTNLNQLGGNVHSQGTDFMNEVMRWQIYRQAFYFTFDADMCAHLYSWSS